MPSQSPPISVIAVTGLGSLAFGLWVHTSYDLWLRVYLLEDIPNVRFLKYGYPLELHKNDSRSILSDHVNNFVTKSLTMLQLAQVSISSHVVLHCADRFFSVKTNQ